MGQRRCPLDSYLDLYQLNFTTRIAGALSRALSREVTTFDSTLMDRTALSEIRAFLRQLTPLSLRLQMKARKP
jgi:hypothetical protein